MFKKGDKVVFWDYPVCDYVGVVSKDSYTDPLLGEITEVTWTSPSSKGALSIECFTKDLKPRPTQLTIGEILG